MISPPDDARFLHEALLYSSIDDLVAAAVPFLHEGARRGEVVQVVSSGPAAEAIRRAVPAGIAGHITFERSTVRYTTPGRTLTNLQQMLRDCARQERRVRVLSEPPLALLPPEQVDEYCRCDAAFNAVCAVPGATVACLYDTRATPAGLLDAVLRSHPRVVEGGRNVRSPVFTDPASLLDEHLRSPPLAVPNGDVDELVPPVDLAATRAFVTRAARRRGLAEPDLTGFTTAANEVVTNGMTHAVLDRVLLWAEDDRVICEVRDHGFGLTDPLAGYRLPELDSTSGRGLWLARQLVDLVEVRSGRSGSTFRLHAWRSGPTAPGHCAV